MTDIQKQMADALTAVTGCTDGNIDMRTMNQVCAALAAHRQQEARGPLALQPIETAPKDGTPILAWNVEYGFRETYSATYTPGSPGFAQGLKDRWWVWDEPKSNWAHKWHPTHWMLLPPTPDAAHGIKGD